jgi:hypothetical protein
MQTEHAIQTVEEAGRVYADALAAEEQASIEASELADQLTASLLGNDNPATGKPHSATSAEKAAKESDQYRDAQRRIVAAKRAHVLARVGYEVAKLNAWRLVRAEVTL